MPKINCYTCDVCRRSVVTVDTDEGITLYSIPCRLLFEGPCPGLLRSSFYINVKGEPSFEWRRPHIFEYVSLSEALREHVDNGGLYLFPIIQKERHESEIQEY